MKSLLIASFLCLAPHAASAALINGISCDEANTTGNADSGMGMDIDADMKHAEISEESIAGPHKIADLECQPQMETMEATPGVHPFLRCTSNDAKKGSFVVEVFAAGLGKNQSMRAVATFTSKAGQKSETKLACKNEK